jgi:pilus assembly protein CpaB
LKNLANKQICLQRNKKMKVAQLAVLGVAVVAAGGAFMVANNLAQKEPEVVTIQEQAPQIELEEVLVATRNIGLGTTLQSDMIEWVKWPKEGLSDGFIIRSNKPDGLALDEDPAIARSQFFVGEPIRESKLVRADKGYMSAILPTGYQAIATTISTATGAGGFILPNDRVDVIMTRQGEADSGNEFITESILENIRVLAIDQTIEEQDGEAVVVGSTATLQLTPKQAKILTVAQQMADRLTLALRSLEDSGDETSSGADYLLSGKRGNGRIRVIKYGAKKDIIAGAPNE